MENDIKLFDYDNPHEFLRKVKELEFTLNRKGFPLFLYAGTLLGVIREQDLLKHDDDIDLFYVSKKSYLKDVLNEFENVISPLLEKCGWEVKPISWTLYTPKRMLGQYHVIKDGISLDLWTAWFDKNDKFHATMFVENGVLTKEDILPAQKVSIRNKKFNAPNNSERFLEIQYGKDWRIPDSKYKNPCKRNFLQKDVLKVIDQFGWAYFFIAKAQQKYSYQKISYKRLQDIKISDPIINDIVYFHSPCMGQDQINQIINNVNRTKTKIIGAYGGENNGRYNEVDLLVTISFPFLNKLKLMYPNKACIFLPEAMDTKYFYSKKFNASKFEVGYVGRPCKVKRTHLLDRLNFPIKKQMDWGKNFFTEDRTLDDVRNFYQSLDCLVLTSQSECMPRVVLEAMSTGLPVVSTDVGCMRMLLEPEWIVPNSTEDDIVKNINDRLTILNKYPEIRKMVGIRNRKHIQQYFDWQNVQQVWDEVINALFLSDYEKINKIGLQLEEQWSSIYKDYIVKPRTDMSMEPIMLTPEEPKQIKSTYDLILDLMQFTILLSKSCLSIIKDKKLPEKEFYLGCKDIQKDETIHYLVSHGFINTFENVYTKDDYTVHLQVYSYGTKKYTFGNIQTKVPCPVITYLTSIFGSDWNNLTI